MGLDEARLMPPCWPGTGDNTDELQRLHPDLGVLPSRADCQTDFSVHVVSKHCFLVIFSNILVSAVIELIFFPVAVVFWV